MIGLLLFLCLVVPVAVAYAEDGFCGDANGVTDRIRSQDRAVIEARGCFALPKGGTLLNTALLVDNPNRHLKVISGVLTLKTQAERDAADAAFAAQLAAIAQRRARINTALAHAVCTPTSLAEFDAAIDSATTVTQLRALFKAFVICSVAREERLQ